jgi:hypothetical protein
MREKARFQEESHVENLQPGETECESIDRALDGKGQMTKHLTQGPVAEHLDVPAGKTFCLLLQIVHRFES